MTIKVHKDLLRQELLSPGVVSFSLAFGLVYLLVSTLLLNFRLLGETFTGSYTLPEKLTIFSSLLQGVTTLYSPAEILLLLVLGVLMGLNFVLIGKSFREQKQRKRSDAALGLGVLGVLATTGCASCGLTIFSLMGPGLSVGLVPFQGALLQGISFVLLTASLIHTLNRRSAVCELVK